MDEKRRARRVVIHGRERIHEGFVRLDRYDVEESAGEAGARYRREVHDHGSGAAVLPVDADRRTVLLVGQVRLPVHVEEGDGYLLEAAAGLVDADDADAAAAARREALEELGVPVTDLRHVATVYTCPGVITERIDCFLAAYDGADRAHGAGGGGVDHDELIDVIEWPIDRLDEALRTGAIRDAKTLILAQALKLARPALFR